MFIGYQTVLVNKEWWIISIGYSNNMMEIGVKHKWAKHKMAICHRLIILLGIYVCITLVSCLTCKSCQPSSCPVVTECSAGLVMDVCNCCAVCAQSEGEQCGGRFELDGKCGIEYYCQLKPLHGYGSPESSIVGICQSKNYPYSGISVPLFFFTN